MVISAVLLVLLVALAVSLIPLRFGRWLVFFAGLALAFGMAGFAFLALGPKDFLTRWPSLVGMLHPYRLGLVSTVAILLSVSTSLGLVARRIFHYVS